MGRLYYLNEYRQWKMEGNSITKKPYYHTIPKNDAKGQTLKGTRKNTLSFKDTVFIVTDGFGVRNPYLSFMRKSRRLLKKYALRFFEAQSPSEESI